MLVVVFVVVLAAVLLVAVGVFGFLLLIGGCADVLMSCDAVMRCVVARAIWRPAANSDFARDLWESCLYPEFTPVDDPT